MRLKHRLLSMAPEFLVSFVCGEGVLRIGTNNKFPGDAHTASPGSMLRESWRKSRIWFTLLALTVTEAVSAMVRNRAR